MEGIATAVVDGGLLHCVPTTNSSCPGKSAKRVFAPDVPGIHVLCAARKVVDGRDKPGHDDVEMSVQNWTD
jgi:hypothetical protein